MILAFLAREGLVDRGDVLAPRIASLQDIRRVHSDVYLESLHDLPVLESILGTQIAESQLDEILDIHRLMVGGTIAAAKIALSSSAVGVNLGGGFHHARPDRGHGFCVYNDLAITVARLRANGFGGRVLVVDLDLHDGDGTRLAFARDPTVHTFSIHNQTWSDAPAVEATVLELGHDFDDRRYLALLDRALPGVITRFDPGLVLYVSGNDVAADDRLGDGHLTPETILERDRRVLSWVRGGLRPRPLAVVLGGGYGPDAWRYTARFLSLIISGRALPTPPTDDLRFARLRYLARLMDPRELTGKSELGLTDEDLGGALGYLARRSRLLDYYTRHGVELALERFGFLDHLRALGYPHPYVDLETGRETGDLLRIFGDASKVDLLVELRVRRDALLVPGHEVLFVEWLLLQNPRIRFDDTHPALPGQAHPGLGLLAEVMTLLRLVCERLHLDAIALVPGHYHVAARAGAGGLRRSHPRGELPGDVRRARGALAAGGDLGRGPRSAAGRQHAGRRALVAAADALPTASGGRDHGVRRGLAGRGGRGDAHLRAHAASRQQRPARSAERTAAERSPALITPRGSGHEVRSTATRSWSSF